MKLEELIFGAKTAWRNVARCSGRSAWETLIVRDCRNVQTVEEFFLELCKHIKDSTNDGIIKPMITVFPQRKPGTYFFVLSLKYVPITDIDIRPIILFFFD